MESTEAQQQQGLDWKACLAATRWYWVVVAVWALVFHEGLLSAIDIWYGNEIFNHCLFVLPGVVFLIYQRRFELANTPSSPNYWGVLLLLPPIFVYAVGLAGDVQLFLHAAMFSALPVLVATMAGWRATRVILFPLLFILFCIPIGEELVPWLQDIAATAAVYLLELSGIAVFRSGLYIEIPNGRFLVAEACSGISFFIASIVIGCLYAYMNLKATWRRATFVLISVIFPIVANGIRVYGIIVIAYATDMEYAAGADHLIYGWFFFAFVIVCLLGLGELIRDGNPDLEQKLQQPESRQTASFSGGKAALGLSLLLVGAAGWYGFIKQGMSHTDAGLTRLPEISQLVEMSQQEREAQAWQPVYKRPTVDSFARMAQSMDNVVVYSAFYSTADSELISGIHRRYDQDDWTIVERVVVASIEPYVIEIISNPNGQLRLLAHWFVLPQDTFASARKTKLAQIKLNLQGENSDGGIIMVSMPVGDRNQSEQMEAFKQYVQELYEPLSTRIRAD